jgi:hypothetical protein
MYRNYVDYPAFVEPSKAEQNKNQAPQTFFEKHMNVIMIGGIVVIVALMLGADVYIRKYIPFVK